MQGNIPAELLLSPRNPLRFNRFRSCQSRGSVPQMTTDFHAKYWAHALTLRHAAGSLDSLSRSIASARVDLNPHQVEAALFALRSPLTRGVILADEVGLGKTIEAGLVLAQRWAERKRRLLLVVPATLRKQWQGELESKFGLPCRILDGDVIEKMKRDGVSGAFNLGECVIIVSYHFASARAFDLANAPWDLVVIDEAHRMRNVFQPSSVLARRIVEAIGSSPKLLLTATPLQNSLMELYGLASVIDPRLFGDAASFRDQFVRATDDDVRDRELKERLKPVSIRTLRRQVAEYIPFTMRVPITQDFTPSDEENALYEDVSAWLQKDILLSLPFSQRTLMTLVLRKLLASSTFAIAATLNRLAKGLEDEVEDLLDDEDLEGIDELRDELEEDPPSAEPPAPETAALVTDLRAEIAELRGFVERARRITSNARGDALVGALRVALEGAVALGAARKAVVFTESRRTQAYLAELLTAKGFAGDIVLMNGTNADPASRALLDRWLAARPAGAPAAGSRAVDMKAAIVDEFRDKAAILIATEAAAEGVNLQFCSLVVNYDLPWNPQRIEQRIGRCHRYGQKHDVVVLNFINRRNEADQRVYELLSQKFRLFDGVFGSSDEVLGALESGVDIERRIAAVYQTCRTPAEIRAAFDKLQGELEGQIQARLARTRSVLLENFDDDVSGRFRVNRDKTVEALGERERWLLALSRHELARDADFDRDRPRFTYRGHDAEAGGYNLDWRDAEARSERFFNHVPLAAEWWVRAG